MSTSLSSFSSCMSLGGVVGDSFPFPLLRFCKVNGVLDRCAYIPGLWGSSLALLPEVESSSDLFLGVLGKGGDVVIATILVAS